MKTLGIIFSFLILIACTIAISFLAAKVVLSIGTLYEIDFISQFSLLQMLGIMFVISIFMQKKEDKESEKKTLMKAFSDSVTFLLARVVFLLFMWGFAFLIYYIAS